MQSADTNLLVRFLLRDDASQYERVLIKIERAVESKTSLFVPLLTILELIWVIEKVYSVPREGVLLGIETLLKTEGLLCEQEQVLQHFIVDAAGRSQDLSDLLIAHSAHSSGHTPVFTFDKKASHHPLFQLLD